MNIVLTFGRATAGVVLLIAGLALARPAEAQQEGFYIGVAYGQSSRSADIAPYDDYAQRTLQGFGFIPNSFSSKIDDKDTAYGFVGGYRFGPHWAVEGGYTNLGDVSYRAKATGNSPAGEDTATFNVDNELSGIIVSGLAIYPISYRMELFARGGLMLTTNSLTTFYKENIRGTDSVQESATDTDLLAAVGLSMSFLEIYGLRLEYMRVFDAGKETYGESDLDLLSLGITVTF